MRTSYISYPFYLLVVVTALSCSSSPEDIGREIAAKECECQRLRADEDVAAQKKLLEDLKKGKFKSRQEFTRDQYSYRIASEETKNTMEECNRQLEKMQADAKLNFPRQEDRTTIMNAYSANYEVMRKEVWKEKNSIEQEIYNLSVKLP